MPKFLVERYQVPSTDETDWTVQELPADWHLIAEDEAGDRIRISWSNGVLNLNAVTMGGIFVQPIASNSVNIHTGREVV